MGSDNNSDSISQHGTLTPDGLSGQSFGLGDSSTWNFLAPVIPTGTDPGLFAPSSAAAAPSGGADSTSGASAISAAGPITNAGSSGFHINVSYDTYATGYSGLSSLESAVNAAVSYLESVITNNITISIQIGWGEVANGVSMGTAVGESSGNANNNVSYSTLRSALITHATSADDAAAVATLPVSDPAAASSYWVTDAQAQALGIGYFHQTYDGYVGLNSIYNYTWDGTAASSKYDAVGVLEHEISEVMGRIGSLGQYIGTSSDNYYTPLDLFRYSSAGVRDLNPTSGSTDYFSVDGQTMLTQYNNPNRGGDAADWATSVSGDAFAAAVSPNTVLSVSQTDLREMDVIGYTLASPACFAAGTRIAGEHGEVAVEALRPGDRVQTRFAGLARVKWVGQRRIDGARHPDPLSVMPVRIAPDAFGPGLPHRTLLLSPEHAVAVDGALIPIRLLLNGGSIAQETTPRTVHYFHVELERHDLLCVEGLLAESYLDTGNRAVFANAGLPPMLHPVFDNSQARREAESCLPLLVDPHRIEPVWHRLSERARQLNFALPQVETTGDAMVSLVVGGRRLAPLAASQARCRFFLPGGARAARLRSRHVMPAALRPWVDDRRRLGIMVLRITLHGPDGDTELAMDDPRFIAGWWAAERDHATIWRWTDGDAELPLPQGTRMVELRLGARLAYPLHDGATGQVGAERRAA